MALRIPSPKALTKPEAYLAYKAGILSRDELKQNLYNPLNNYEGWLAKWCGLLETYPTNEDGTPQCLTDEEGLLAYLCGVTDRYPASNSRPDDARISAYIRYLVSARYIRPDHPLNREEFYLSLIKTQFIPSGDPSSDIVIDGTTKAPFVDVKLYGDTAQNSYTGKNLSPNAGAYNFNTNQTATILSQTESSITFKTSGNNNSGILMYKNTQSEVCPEMFEDGYIFSCTAVADSTITLRFGTSGDYTEAVIGTTPTRISAPLNNKNWICYSGTTVVSTITISDFQVEAGSTATSYEPFVGGQPSPSPDYPQQIQTVTGEQTVTVVGKNLFNKDSYQVMKAYFTTSTTTITSDSSNRMLYIACEPNTTYTVSKETGAVFNVGYTNSLPAIGTSVYGTQGGSSLPSQTLTTGANAKYLVCRFYQTVLDTTTQVKMAASIQIEKGSTATAYEPYSSNDYEINLGKNLWSATTLVTGYYKFADGDLVTGGNPNYVTSIEKIDVTAGESYHISADKGAGVAGSGCVFFNNDTFVSSLVNPSGGNFTVPKGANKMVFNFFNNAGLSPSEVTHIQLEKGSTATDYAPYFEPIELCRIDGYDSSIYRDTIYKNLTDSKWYLRKELGKYVFNGSEAWAQSSRTKPDMYVGALNIVSLGITANETRNKSLANRAIIVTTSVVGTFSIFNVSSGVSQYMCYAVSSSYAASLAQFKEKLATDNLIVYAPLATPTDTEITNSALVEQLEALVKGGAEEGTTYIKVSATDPNLPAKLYVEAPKYD